MTIHSFPTNGTPKEESPPSTEHTHTLSNNLNGQLPAIELPNDSTPRLVTLASTNTSDILKEYFVGEQPSTLAQDTSDPRVFNRTHSSAVSSTQACIPNDEQQLFIRNRKAADQGDAGAQLDLGCAYADGRGVKQDDVQAVHWYRKAAEQGNAGAQFKLGRMCQRGLGVKQDDAQAVVWYRKAAEQGQASAQYNLGWMYDRGLGVKRDYNQALIWFRMVAEQGDADAQFQIGTMYATGKGVEVNDVEAFNWYFKAAKNGSAYAQLELASVYHQGLGVKKDVLQATYWFLKSVGEDLNRKIVLSDDGIAMDCYSDVIQCIPAAFTTFPELKYIKTINFQKTDLFAKDFLSIGEMIRANTHLEGLNFEFQIIDDAQALILSQSLAFNTTLTELIFDDEYGFDASIFDEIKASLAQNVVIAELREHMKNHPITCSDELPLEVLDIIVDDMIVAASKSGKSKEATIAAIDEFLLSVSQQKLKDDLKKSS